MQRTLESRVFISAILAMAAGTFLLYARPFPDEQIFLHVIALREAMPFTGCVTSRLTKTRPKCLYTLASTKNASGWCPTTTKANPCTIGLLRSAPSLAATIPKSLFSASPTTARTTNAIRITTRATL